MDLREMKATVTERLRATETSLIDSRLRANAGEHREQQQLQKISALEAEVRSLRDHQNESPLQALRLHEEEKQSANLAKQLDVCQAQLKDAKTGLETKHAEATKLRNALEATKAGSVELQAQVEALTLEKAVVESQAIQNEERIRAELSEASKNEISRNANRFLNEIQSLRNQASAAEKKGEADRSMVEQLQAEKSAALEHARQLEISASRLQEQVKASQATSSHLEADLDKTLDQKAELEIVLHQTQEELRQLRKTEVCLTFLSMGSTRSDKVQG